MTFVKPPGEDTTQVTRDVSVDGLDEVGSKAVGDRLAQAVGAVENVLAAGAIIKDVSEGGLKSIGEKAIGIATDKVTAALGHKIAEVAGGSIAGVGGGIIDGLADSNVGSVMNVGAGAGSNQELPIFAEKAITSFTGGMAVKSVAGADSGVVGKAAGAIASRLGGKNLELKVASRDALGVLSFSVEERISSLFQVNLIAVSDNPSLDFDAIVGQSARFTLRSDTHDRSWSGLCNHFEQVRVEPTGLSTYQLAIVPALWLLTQRKNHRMFQHISEPDIVLKVLKEWNIEPEVRIDRAAYKKRKYRVQYAESDFAFISRMLEDAGIAYYFELIGEETKLVLSDAPHGNTKRALPLMFQDETSMARRSNLDFATHVRMGKHVRPGKYTLQDHDYRRPPSYKLISSASGGDGIEGQLERYQYTPGAFLFGTDQGDASPAADDRGKTRTDEDEAAILAQKRLDAKRGSAKVCTFETNAFDLAPGIVMNVAGHPNEALGEGRTMLVVESSLSGIDHGEWSLHCEARGTDVPFRPELVTPKPKVNGVESATVVGRPGEEIHTDEFGRARVHFHWDRESQMNDNSSCWIHVSQSWGGSGFGGMSLPRVGQEVLVDFLGGDPDRPIIVGRVYTNLQKVPYKLPENKSQSGWRSNSTGGTGGYNELMFEDAHGNERLNIQAQKDLHKLVKNNESVTIGNNRQKLVKSNETQRVGANRMLVVGGNSDTVVKKVKKERVEGDSHLTVKGNRKQKIGGSQSLTVVGDQQQKVGKKHALEATREIHFKSGDKLVIEAAQDLTIKTPGGFIRIDASGVTIKGLVVKINSGGSPGTGSGSAPEEPDDAADGDPKS